MPYGNLLADVVQSSVTGTPPQFNDGAGTQTGTLCRAWVNFNGTGTVAIRASFNVSSITDNGTGDYTVNFTNALSDANYAFAGGVKLTSDGTNYRSLYQGSATAPAVGSCRFTTSSPSSGNGDVDIICVTIFR